MALLPESATYNIVESMDNTTYLGLLKRASELVALSELPAVPEPARVVTVAAQEHDALTVHTALMTEN